MRRRRILQSPPGRRDCDSIHSCDVVVAIKSCNVVWLCSHNEYLQRSSATMKSCNDLSPEKELFQKFERLFLVYKGLTVLSMMSSFCRHTGSTRVGGSEQQLERCCGGMGLSFPVISCCAMWRRTRERACCAQSDVKACLRLLPASQQVCLCKCPRDEANNAQHSAHGHIVRGTCFTASAASRVPVSSLDWGLGGGGVRAGTGDRTGRLLLSCLEVLMSSSSGDIRLSSGDI